MVTREQGVLNRVVIRRLLYCRQHAQFLQRLRWVARVREGVRVVIASEAYTTRTCSFCFRIRGPFAGELFVCENAACPVSVNPLLRDLNAAAVILMRALGRITQWDAFPRSDA